MAAPGRIILAVGLLLAVALALPGETVATRLLEDLFAILDGVQRVSWGQVPNRDFRSAFGPLAAYIPALGYWLTGSLGAALPLGNAIVVAVVAAVLAYVLPSRLSPALAIPFGFFLLVVLAAPLNLGDGITALSFNQFFNRIGWVGLAALLVLFLPVRGKIQPRLLLDVACAAGLVLLLIYTRATYGLVALAFLLFMLTDRRQWRWAALSLAAVVVAAGLIELVWRSSFAYAQDVGLALAAGGLLRGTPAQWLELFLGNFADYILLGFLSGLLFWRRCRLRDLLFVLFCALAGFWLINQNDQRWGIIVMHAAAAAVAERLLREMAHKPASAGQLVNAAGVQLFLFGLLFPTMVHCTAALLLHAGTAVVNGGQSLAIARLERVRLADLWTPGEFGGSRWYLDLVGDGLRALEAADQPPGRIVVLGGPNPFSATLDLAPATGDVAQMRWGATHNPAHHIGPEQFLSSADTVMERLAAGGTGDLGAVYLPYVTEHFTVAAQTRDWRIYQRTTGAEPTIP